MTTLTTFAETLFDIVHSCVPVPKMILRDEELWLIFPKGVVLNAATQALLTKGGWKDITDQPNYDPLEVTWGHSVAFV